MYTKDFDWFSICSNTSVCFHIWPHVFSIFDMKHCIGWRIGKQTIIDKKFIRNIKFWAVCNYICGVSTIPQKYAGCLMKFLNEMMNLHELRAIVITSVLQKARDGILNPNSKVAFTPSYSTAYNRAHNSIKRSTIKSKTRDQRLLRPHIYTASKAMLECFHFGIMSYVKFLNSNAKHTDKSRTRKRWIVNKAIWNKYRNCI